MLNLRISIVILVLWLGVLFNIERLHEPINLASFVYVLCSWLVVVILCIPKIRKLTLLEITIGTIPVYAYLKWFLGYEFGGSNLSITVTETVVIGVTNLLAFRVANGMDEFVKTAGQAAELELTNRVLTGKDDEAALYEEVQRARRFNRKLTLATLSFQGKFSAAEVDAILEKARNEIVRKYVESRISIELTDSAQPGDLIAFRDGEFILMFPEAETDEVKLWLQNVNRNLSDEIGLQLRFGMASFPDQECTLTGLIERAGAQLTVFEQTDFPSDQGPADDTQSEVMSR